MSNNAFSRGLTFVEQGGFDTSTTALTAISASGAGSEGAWTEVIASTDADADTIDVYIIFISGGGSVEDFLIDIGIGPSSEQAIIENIPFSGRVASAGGLCDFLSFPVQIPAGTRVVARAIADSGSAVVGVGLSLYKGGEKSYSFSGAKGYGVTANWGGTPVDAGGTANTKGGWVELAASTTETIRGFWLHMGLLENITIGTTTGDMIDISIGPAATHAGNENSGIVVLNHFLQVNTFEFNLASKFFDIEIPAGSRIAAQRQCSDTDATDRIRSVALVGLI